MRHLALHRFDLRGYRRRLLVGYDLRPGSAWVVSYGNGDVTDRS